MSKPPPLEEIFFAALEMGSAEERSSYLEEACAGDQDLRRRVDKMLAAQSQGRSFLESPAAAGIVATVDQQPITEAPGALIGPYKIIEQIGEGGMGTVWMAQQTEPVKRLVAVKLIKAGMDSKQVIARFEAERQALALMDHANIARVLEAGTTDGGRPYFVMDLVKGMPITRFCDEHHLTPRQRLELFIPVCQAVQHAHQKGIIHRDLKPSNVLVALYDGKPVPKVIDFGVAKAAGQQLTDKTLVTGFGAIVGTLEYMSPEQAEINQLDIDTRSDIYSLGVLLYELLAGSPPFSRKELEKAGMLEMLRVIREQEPSKPSTKLSTAEGLPTLAANRGTEPAKLAKLVRGELDWIVMKALEKDRSRRYETANGLAMDIQRYMTDEPVLAGPPSAAYRFRKFARRNRAALTMAAVVAVALVLGIVGTTWQAIRAIHERDRAVAAEGLAQTRLESETRARREVEVAHKDALSQRDRALKAEVQAEANFRKARQAVDEYFTLVSESKLLDVPGLQPLRKQLLEAAQRYYQGFVDEREQDPKLRGELAATYLRVAQIYEQNDRADDAIRTLQRGLELLEDLLREKPHNADFPQQFAGFRKGGRLAQLWHRWESDIPSAIRTYQKAEAIWEDFAREYPSVAGFQSDLASFSFRMGDLQWRTMDAQALPAFQKASEIWDKLARENPKVPEYRADVAESLDHVGKVLMDTDPRESEAAYRRGLALREKLVAEFPDHPDYRAGLANSFRRLSTALHRFGRLGEAEKAGRQSLAMWEKLTAEFPKFPAYRKLLAGRHDELGTLLKEMGRPQEAEKALRQALAIKEKLAAEFPDNEADSRTELCESLGLLARLLKDTGRPQEAEKAYRQAVELSEKLVLDIPTVAWHRDMLSGYHRELAGWLQAAGRHQDAETASRHAIDFYSKLSADFPSSLDYRASLSASYAHLVELLISRATLVERDSKLSQAYRAQAGDLLRDHARLGLPNPAAFFNASAWRLATDPNPDNRNPASALELAKLAVERAPDQAYILNTLGTVYYRTGDWKAAIETLKDADELYQGRLFSSDAFFVAMASWQLGEKDAARKWYQAAARWMDKFAAGDTEQRGFRAEAAGLIGPAEQAAVAPQQPPRDDRQLYTLILDAWPEAAWAYLRRGQVHDSAAEPQRAQADYRHAIDRYERVVQRHPKSWVPWAGRGSACAGSEQWAKAAGDFEKAAALGAAPAVWYQAALARLAAHDLAGYRETCAGILERLDKPEAGGPAQLGLWACAIGPDAVVDLARAIALAEKAVQGTPKSAQYVGTLGALLYRGGRLDEAVRKLEEADRLAQVADARASSPAYTRFFLAMAQHRLGHTAEAKKWFNKAREHTEKALRDHAAGTTRLPWNRRLTLTLCRQETQEVLGLGTLSIPQWEPK